MARTVVITGASAGIGRATARAFARQGDAVALLARGEAGLEGAARDVAALGGRALPIVTDVADEKQVEEAARRIEEELGPVDVWINNAMVTVFSSFAEITPKEFRRVTEVTYLGTVYGTMAALRRMRERDHGHIIQVGSAVSYRAIPLQSAYSGAKFAVRGFTDALRSELLHEESGVHLTMVQLPAHNTPQFAWSRTHVDHQPQPLPPIFQPEVAAQALVWAAAHPRRREVTVGWPALQAIQGNKFFPSAADRYLARTGFDAQMTGEDIDPDRPGNLFTPLDDAHDHGAHGPFDARAKGRSAEWELASRKRLLGTGLLAGAGAAGWLWRRKRHQQEERGRREANNRVSK